MSADVLYWLQCRVREEKCIRIWWNRCQLFLWDLGWYRSQINNFPLHIRLAFALLSWWMSVCSNCLMLGWVHFFPFSDEDRLLIICVVIKGVLHSLCLCNQPPYQHCHDSTQPLNATVFCTHGGGGGPRLTKQWSAANPHDSPLAVSWSRWVCVLSHCVLNPPSDVGQTGAWHDDVGIGWCAMNQCAGGKARSAPSPPPCCLFFKPACPCVAVSVCHCCLVMVRAVGVLICPYYPASILSANSFSLFISLSVFITANSLDIADTEYLTEWTYGTVTKMEASNLPTPQSAAVDISLHW